MEAKEAIRLVSELVSAEVDIMRQMQSRGTTTKKADKAERDAAREIFTALTGNDPTDEEITEMVSL